jgi:hypothetical protein
VRREVGVVLWIAARRHDLLGGYAYPRWLVGLGVLAWLTSIYRGYNSLTGLSDLF